MRLAVKKDLGCLLSEMTLGTQLRLRGQCFAERQAGPPQSAYGKQMVEFMSTLQPILPREPSKRYSHFSDKAPLQTCTHVYITNDATKSSLGRAYKGPNKVVKKQFKLFTLNFGHKYDVVLVDHLKAAIYYLIRTRSTNRNRIFASLKLTLRCFSKVLLHILIRILS